MRERIVACHSLASGCMAYCSTPSMRYFTTTSVLRVSMWMSLARRSSAVKITVSTRRTTGLTPVSRVSLSIEMFSSLSSSSLTTCSVKPSVAWSRTRWDCSVRFSRSPICEAVATLICRRLPSSSDSSSVSCNWLGSAMATTSVVVVRFQRHEVVAEHQFGGNAAEQVRDRCAARARSTNGQR